MSHKVVVCITCATSSEASLETKDVNHACVWEETNVQQIRDHAAANPAHLLIRAYAEE